MTDEELKQAAEEYTTRMIESWEFDSTGLRPPRESFIAGAEWMKKQMMEEAVEGEVKDFRFIREVNYASAKIEFDSIPDLKEGDKVRVIIVKE